MPAYCNVKGNMMKNVTLKFAVLSALTVLSAPVFATGFVSLPAAGLTVAATTNQPAGTTGWVRCNTTGNYGSGEFTAPTTGANNTCAVFPGAINTTPVTGFTLVSASNLTSTITANSETLATMTSRTFRNTANTECIYGKRISFATTGTFDYNPQLTGSQRLEVNDVAFGGFSATAGVSAGYYYTSITDSPVYRMGRAFTSVQMQSDLANVATLPATGFVHRPLNSPAPTASTDINGVGQTFTGSVGTLVPTAAQQTSEIRTNWVDFTMDNTGGVDEDGTTVQDTSMMYVRAACTSAAPVSTANTVRIRQAGQETQPWVTILAPGLTRSGANANF